MGFSLRGGSALWKMKFIWGVKPIAENEDMRKPNYSSCGAQQWPFGMESSVFRHLAFWHKNNFSGLGFFNVFFSAIPTSTPSQKECVRDASNIFFINDASIIFYCCNARKE